MTPPTVPWFPGLEGHVPGAVMKLLDLILAVGAELGVASHRDYLNELGRYGVTQGNAEYYLRLAVSLGLMGGYNVVTGEHVEPVTPRRKPPALPDRSAN